MWLTRSVSVHHGVLALVLAAAVAASGLTARSAAARGLRFHWSRPVAVDRSPVDRHGGWIGQIVCPTASFCAALDASGKLLSTQHPAAGARSWRARRIVRPPESLAALACPSARLCVAVSTTGALLSSTHPTGRASAWRRTGGLSSVIPGVEANATFQVACPRSSLCLAANGDEGTLMVSTDPARDRWRPEQIVDPKSGCELGAPSPCAQQITALACPSATACVAVDDNGDALGSTDPAGGASSWRAVSTGLDPIPGAIDPLNRLSCPSPAMCVTADTEHGAVASSADPTRAAASWTARRVATHFGFLLGLDCPTTSLCLGARGLGPLIVSTRPRADQWRTLDIGLTNGGPVSCVGERFCAVGGGGAIAVSSRPARASSWAVTRISNASITALACPTRTLCVAGDVEGGISTGRPDRTGAAQKK